MSINDFHQQENLTQNSKLLLTPNQKKKLFKKKISIAQIAFSKYLQKHFQLFLFFIIPFLFLLLSLFQNNIIFTYLYEK